MDSHKRTYGHALIIGGSPRYPHAPVLAAQAAYRAGCGLVSLAVPDCARPAAAFWAPEAIFAEETPGDLADFEAIAIGPGMGPLAGERLALLRRLASDAQAPRTVVDADALTALAALRQAGWAPDGSALRLILTPHPGEMSRLQNAFGLDSSKHRIEQALDLSYVTGAVVILKGSRSITASPAGDYCINMSGCAALSTAGSGDTLTGICGALLAEGYDAFDAARMGAFLHGLCGEILSPYGSRGILADDLADVIPQALKRILPTA